MNPTHGRAKRGVKLYQETIGKRTKKDNVAAGYLNGIILALCIYSWATDTEWFCLWFEHTLIPLLKPNSVIVMDNRPPRKLRNALKNLKWREVL